MVKIGLVGEDPNDTLSIKNLLLTRYKNGISFHQLAKGVKGYQLDTEKLKRTLIIEMEDQNINLIIYIRDLDAFKTNKSQLKNREDWFHKLNNQFDKNGLLLLNIWELEALILADIDTFNQVYHISHRFTGDPSNIENPKETLKRLTSKSNKKYKESDCPEIFKKLDIEVIKNKCGYFNSFIKNFAQKLTIKE